MSGYIESGYIVVLGSLVAYGASLLERERRIARRLRRGEPGNDVDAPDRSVDQSAS